MSPCAPPVPGRLERDPEKMRCCVSPTSASKQGMGPFLLSGIQAGALSTPIDSGFYIYFLSSPNGSKYPRALYFSRDLVTFFLVLCWLERWSHAELLLVAAHFIPR